MKLRVLKGFGQRLAAAIADKKKAVFAFEISVRPHQLSRYLRGQIPDPETLVRISTVTGRSLDWLLLGKELPMVAYKKREDAIQAKQREMKSLGKSRRWAEFARVSTTVDKLISQLKKETSRSPEEMDLLLAAQGISEPVDVPIPPDHRKQIRQMLEWYGHADEDHRKLLQDLFKCVMVSPPEGVKYLKSQLTTFRSLIDFHIGAESSQTHLRLIRRSQQARRKTSARKRK